MGGAALGGEAPSDLLVETNIRKSYDLRMSLIWFLELDIVDLDAEERWDMSERREL